MPFSKHRRVIAIISKDLSNTLLVVLKLAILVVNGPSAIIVSPPVLILAREEDVPRRCTQWCAMCICEGSTGGKEMLEVRHVNESVIEKLILTLLFLF